MLQRAGARRVLGGDYSLALLRDARSHYGDRVPLLRLSATDLPLRDRSFDLVIFFEATYYVPDMEASFREIARILSPQGTLLIASANPERPDFIPSPHSTRYYTAAEFRSSLERLGFRVSVSGAFPVMSSSTSVPRRAGATMLRTIRRILQFLGLVPRTLKGRARLKRLLYGSLVPVPRELTPGFATGTTLAPVSTGPVVDFKVIYIKADRTS